MEDFLFWMIITFVGASVSVVTFLIAMIFMVLKTKKKSKISDYSLNQQKEI